MPDTGRSYLTIRASDLRRLAEIARTDREDFFRRLPRWSKLYSNRLLCVALCQGAALHYVDGRNGIKDFDIWSFFRVHPDGPLPRRPVVACDFGDPRFGKSDDRPGFTGRRVDLLLKSIDAARGEAALSALRRYLARGRTHTASCLARKAVILIDPPNLLGVIAWPVSGKAA